MVVIQLCYNYHKEEDCFLFETTCNIYIKELIKQLVEIQNERLKLKYFIMELEKFKDYEINEYNQLDEKKKLLLERIIQDTKIFLSKVK